MSLPAHGNRVSRRFGLYRKLTSSMRTTRPSRPSLSRPKRSLNGEPNWSKLTVGAWTLMPQILLIHVVRLRTATHWIPIHLQILITLQRGFQRLRNLPGPVIGSVVANGILALVIGSVYYDLPETSNSMDRRALLIFLSTLLTALSPAFEVSLCTKAFRTCAFTNRPTSGCVPTGSYHLGTTSHRGEA